MLFFTWITFSNFNILVEYLFMKRTVIYLYIIYKGIYALYYSIYEFIQLYTMSFIFAFG